MIQVENVVFCNVRSSQFCGSSKDTLGKTSIAFSTIPATGQWLHRRDPLVGKSMVTPAQGELEYEVMLDAKVNLTDGTAWDSMGQLRSDMVGLKRIENGLKTIELVEHLHTQPIIGRVKTSKLLDLGVSIRPLTRCDLQISRCLADNCHVMSCIYI